MCRHRAWGRKPWELSSGLQRGVDHAQEPQLCGWELGMVQLPWRQECSSRERRGSRWVGWVCPLHRFCPNPYLWLEIQSLGQVGAHCLGRGPGDTKGRVVASLLFPSPWPLTILSFLIGAWRVLEVLVIYGEMNGSSLLHKLLFFFLPCNCWVTPGFSPGPSL